MNVAGRYELLELIGVGGFGEVWEANQLADARREGAVAIQKVALKLLPASGDPALNALFNEVLAIRDLDSSAVVRVYDAGIAEEQSVAYIAMERLVGETLAQRLKRGPIYWRRALHIARAIAQALETCHKQNLIHADLKPENIFLESRPGGHERVRVLDFGISHIAHQAPPAPITMLRRDFDSSAGDSTAVTDLSGETGASAAAGSEPAPPRRILGTPGYVPAEVLGGQAPGASSDAFALGVVIFMMLAGQLPQRIREHQHSAPSGSGSGRSVRRALNAASLKGDLDGAAELTSLGVPPAFAQLVERLLSEDPTDRIGGGLTKDLASVWSSPFGTPDPPYRGLSAFSFEQAGHLHGRAADVRALMWKLRESHFVTLLGPSGAGKSSLAAAGVGPMLDESFLLGTDGWRVKVIRPSSWPGISSASIPPAPVQPTQYEREPGTLIVLDQLEEVLNLDPDVREQILPQVLGLIHGDLEALHRDLRPAGQWRCIATLRGDMLERVAEHLERGLEQEVYILRSVDPNGVKDLITEPANCLGYRLDNQEEVIAKASEMLERDARALPLVQFAMERWWEQRDVQHRRLTAEAWSTLGGFDGAIGQSANELFESFDKAEQATMRSLFLRLFDLDGTRQRVPDTAADDTRRTVVEALIERRLIRRTGGHVPALEVVHETLALQEPVRTWLDTTRSERELLASLTTASEQWDKRGRPDEALWRGTQLKEAVRLRDQGALPELNKEALPFIQESERAVKRARLYWFISPAAVAIAAFGVALFFSFQADAARREAKLQRELAEQMQQESTRAVAEVSETRRHMAVQIAIAEKQSREQMHFLETEYKNLLDERVAVEEDLAETQAQWHQRLEDACAAAGGNEFSSKVQRAAIEFATYFLDTPRESGHADMTATLLKHRRCLEEHLPRYLPGWQWRQDHERSTAAKWTAHYSALQALDEGYLSLGWDEMAQSFRSAWGYTPPDGQYEKRTDLPAGRIVIKPPFRFSRAGDPEPDVTIEIPRVEGLACVSLDNLSDAQKAYFEANKARHGFEPYAAVAKYDAHYWLVPQWTMPVWNIEGRQHSYPAEHCVAIHMANALKAHPHILLDADNTTELLDHYAGVYPVTIAEARAARGERLRDDLVAILKQDRGLNHLPVFLDLLADDPAATSAASADRTSDWLDGKAPGGLAGARPWPELKYDRDPGCRDRAPICTRPIRVFLGTELLSSFVKDRKLQPETLALIERARNSVYLRYGVEMPSVSFVSEDEPERKGELRVVWLHDAPKSVDPLALASTPPTEALERELELSGGELARYWITPEWIAAKAADWPKPLNEWLRKHYSVTDLKRIMRAVIAPDPNRSWLAAQEPHSLHQLQWLTTSLVFWHPIQRDVAGLADALRKTQRARDATHGPTEGPAAGQVREGIDHLLHERFADAEAAFGRALALDEELAISTFLAAYASESKRAADGLMARCHADEGLDPDDAKLLATQLANGSLEAADVPQARYCTWRNSSGQARNVELEKMLRLGIAHQLRADRRLEIGLAALARYEMKPIARHLRRKGSDLIASALRDAKPRRRPQMFGQLVQACDGGKRKSWCPPLYVQIASEVALPVNVFTRGYGVGGVSVLDQLLNCMKAECTERTNAILSIANAIPDVPAEDRALLKFAEAYLLTRTALDEGRRTALNEIEQRLLPLTSVTDPDWIAPYALGLLGRAYSAAGDFPKALRYLGGPVAKDSSLASERMSIALMQGNVEAARMVVDEVQSDDDHAVFLSALVGTIAHGASDWEERAYRLFDPKRNHPYQPYIVMMASARFAASDDRDGQADAQRLLEQHWNRSQRPGWPARAEAGDQDVWREMLIHYFLGKLPREKVLGPLESQAALDRSFLKHLPYTLRELRCEGYFYEAILQMRDGGDWRGSLEKVIATGYRSYYEYGMAVAMLQKAPPLVAKKKKKRFASVR